MNLMELIQYTVTIRELNNTTRCEESEKILYRNDSNAVASDYSSFIPLWYASITWSGDPIAATSPFRKRIPWLQMSLILLRL